MGGLALWSLEEEFVFEAALASAHSKAGEEDGIDFDAIAQLLPGKTRADIEHRYHLLLDDVAKIEEGEEVAVVYYGVQGAHGPPKTPNARGRLQYLQGLIAQQQHIQVDRSGGAAVPVRRPDLSPDKKVKI